MRSCKFSDVSHEGPSVRPSVTLSYAGRDKIASGLCRVYSLFTFSLLETSFDAISRHLQRLGVAAAGTAADAFAEDVVAQLPVTVSAVVFRIPKVASKT